MKSVAVRDAVVRYRRGVALDGISLVANEGEHVAVLGPPGGGKSTLLNLLAGGIQPDQGTVEVLGAPPRGVMKRIGFRRRPLSAGSLLTPAQVLTAAQARHDVPGYQRSARAAEILNLFDLYHLRDRPIRELGHTAAACANIAATLAYQPALLLLDGVTQELPPRLQERLITYLRDRRSVDGLTVIQVTMSSNEAETADRVILLDSGQIVADAPPAELLACHASDTIVLEPADSLMVRRSLRGIRDIVIEETETGMRISTADAAAVTARLLETSGRGFRTLFIRQPTLWDVIDRLQANRSAKSR